jgi:hypothetical protein
LALWCATRVERIVLRGKEIDIVLKNRAGEPTSTADEESESAGVGTVLKAGLPAARPRARKQIILPGGSGSGPRHVDQALVLALARARAWMRALRDGDDTETAGSHSASA